MDEIIKNDNSLLFYDLEESCRLNLTPCELLELHELEISDGEGSVDGHSVDFLAMTFPQKSQVWPSLVLLATESTDFGNIT